MLLVLASMIGVGLIAGWVTAGSIQGLKQIKLRVAWILFISVIVAVLPLFSEAIADHRRLIEIVSFGGVLLFLVVNILTSRGEVRAALLVIAAGWTLNAIVIAANGGMPLSRSAYASSGQTATITQGKGGFYRSVVAGPHTTFRFLGDVIPVKIYHQVISLGDIFLMLGIVFVIVAAMRTVRRGSHAE
jgi:Family of unknown function (DUF5317)